MAKISVKKFLDINDNKNNPLKLRRLTGLAGLEDNFITSHEINRPGMVLFGYYEDFAFDRIQIFGRGEGNYAIKLEEENKIDLIEKFFSYDIPVSIFSHGIMPGELIIKASLDAAKPLLFSELPSGVLIRRISSIFGEEFSAVSVLHGVFIDVFGVGILIKGRSGVGKSEATLELLSRGHRLVADDSVELRRLNDDLIIGKTSKTLAHYMEVRGIGVVDISRLSGMSAIRDRKRLDLIVELVDWDESADYDRTGLDDKREDVMGVDISYLKIPIRSGRNVSVLIETASKNHRLKTLGYNSAKELNNNMIKSLQDGANNNL
jgi:HPr kinase/phosphorylase